MTTKRIIIFYIPLLSVVFWDIIDADTRFILVSQVAISHSMGEANELILKAASS